MRRLYLTYFPAIAVGFAFALFSPAVHAQMYPQDIHSQHRPSGSSAPAQQWSGGMGVDSSSAFLQRREEEERERRESQERQRRMMENFTNIPDQLRQSYFKRPELPFNSR
jgi:hypothetical protein